MKQARDFRDECDDLHALLAPLDETALERRTPFKNWTLNDIVRHLHAWNLAADGALTDSPGSREFVTGALKHLDGTLRDYEAAYLDGASGPSLVTNWREHAAAMAARYSAADPSARVAWVGPPMSVRSAITARQMETWAHGQAAFDLMGSERRNTDRIRNIVVLGVNTFGWTFAVRGESPPGPMPYLVLTAPSGAVWRYGEPSDVERIEGSAVAFCQVVTQTRNIADTTLSVEGPVATAWMRKAQCFAGPPHPPPPPGTRKP